jgi:hypothetical protein
LADGPRPEIRAALWRGREVLAGLALVLLALWLSLGSFGITRWVAGAMGLLGFAVAWTGLQRMRFARGGGGPGVVTVDERQLSYWGPLTGGVVDLDNLLRLDLDPSGQPAHWVLTPIKGEALAVPVTAQGAEALLDLFTALPGLKVEALIAALGRTNGPPVTLWALPNVVAFPPPRRGGRLH